MTEEQDVVTPEDVARHYASLAFSIAIANDCMDKGVQSSHMDPDAIYENEQAQAEAEACDLLWRNVKHLEIMLERDADFWTDDCDLSAAQACIERAKAEHGHST